MKALLKRNAPAWLDSQFHSTFEAGMRGTHHVSVVGIVIYSNIAGHFDVTPVRRATQANAGHTHDHSREHSWRGAVVRRLREGDVVATLSLSPVHYVQAKWRPRYQCEVEPQLHLVIVTESPAKTHAKDFVILSWILVAIRKV